MKESNILNLIEITKNSEVQEKNREEFLDFIQSGESEEPKNLLKQEIEQMFTQLFIVEKPSQILGRLQELVIEDDGESFLELFPFDNRRFSSKLWEYKKTKEVLDAFFKLTIYKGLTSDSNFCRNLISIKDSDLPNMIGPMARPTVDEWDSSFKLNSIETLTSAERFFRNFVGEGADGAF